MEGLFEATMILRSLCFKIQIFMKDKFQNIFFLHYKHWVSQLNQDMKENLKSKNIKKLVQKLHQFAGIKWGSEKKKKKNREKQYFLKVWYF